MAKDPSSIATSHQPLAIASVRQLMWKSVGLFRTREGLTAAGDALAAAGVVASPATADEWRQRNLVTVARLIARAALRREESRGGHFRADFPERDDVHWKVHAVEVKK
jgi:L-aspartate oxidase